MQFRSNIPMKTKLLVAICLALQFFSFIPPAFAQTAYIGIGGGGSAFENAAAATVAFERSGNTNTVVTVEYATRDGSAKAGVDYTAVSGALAFAAGETEKTISVPLADDDGVVDGDKTFRVCLTNADGGALIEYAEGIVTIQDNEVPANLDYSFNPVISSGQYGDVEVSSFATLPDGRLVIGGYFTRVNGVERFGFACLNADGSLAPAFQTRLLYAGQLAGTTQMTPLPDGRLYIAGNFDSVNGVDRPGLARLLQDGSLDVSFAPTNLFNSSSEIVQTDGKIITLTSDGELIRLNLDGQKDNSFVTTLLSNSDIYALAQDADGRLLVSGADRIIRLNTNGSLDNSFGPVPGGASKLLVQPDQKILAAGAFYSTNGVLVSNLERLNADGSLDTGFHAETGVESYAYAFNLAEDGTIIFLSGYPPVARRLNADGSLDGTFPGFHLIGHFDLSGYHASIRSTGASVYAYGNFLSINGGVVHGLGRILLENPPRTGIDIQCHDIRGYYYSYLQEIGEHDGLLTAKVRRLGQTTGPATVTWATRDGTAKAGKDYIATTGTLTFAPLEVEKMVRVPVLDNATVDGRRTLQLYLTNAVGAALIAPPLIMTIVDDEVGFAPGTLKRLPDGSVRMIV
jgi:uncharacterized delta-60 repeat protein